MSAGSLRSARRSARLAANLYFNREIAIGQAFVANRHAGPYADCMVGLSLAIDEECSYLGRVAEEGSRNGDTP